MPITASPSRTVSVTVWRPTPKVCSTDAPVAPKLHEYVAPAGAASCFAVSVVVSGPTPEAGAASIRVAARVTRRVAEPAASSIARTSSTVPVSASS